MNTTHTDARTITRNDLAFLQARMRQEILRTWRRRKLAVICGHCGRQASPCACDPLCLIAEVTGLF